MDLLFVVLCFVVNKRSIREKGKDNRKCDE